MTGTGMAGGKLGEVEKGLLRSPLVNNCLYRLEVKMGKLRENFDVVREVWLSSNLDELRLCR